MKISQKKWSKTSGWESNSTQDLGTSANLVLAFSKREILEDKWVYDSFKDEYPNANILLCSTGGEIMDTSVIDNSIVVTAVQFEKATIKTSRINISDCDNSYYAGQALAGKMQLDGLSNLFVISDGHLVNGSDLVRGLNSVVPDSIPITGGMAGDGAKFEKTLVGLDGHSTEGEIAIVGFYGKDLKVGHGSKGGWDSFGTERVITKSENNVLYELDGKPALDLYEEYLGEDASGLPENSLLFPLSLKIEERRDPLVRTVLSIDKEARTMTFAGNMPEECKTRLMRANFARLIDGAKDAAYQSFDTLYNDSSGSRKKSPELAILISCVGRKLVLNHRIDDEIEGVRNILGKDTAIAGFYSYGEISPLVSTPRCELHNQTMTITTFSENG